MAFDRYKATTTICAICIYAVSYCQSIKDQNKSETIDRIVEANAEVSTNEDEDLSTYFDELYHYYDHPINLNRTTQDELLSLGILSDYQANNLLQHIQRFGKLISIYELQAIPGWNLELIKTILPFIKVNDNFDSPNLSFKEVLKNGKNEVFIRSNRTLEQAAGFITPLDSIAEAKNRYLGNPDQLFFKYRFKYGNNISIGFVGEKDRGEEFFRGTQKQGFDFHSAHLFLKDIGKIKQFALGDYQVQIGQGLTFWTGRYTIFSAYTLDVKRNPKTIKPYTSAGEFGFLRGAAANVKLGNFEILGFYSNKNIDGSIDTTLNSLDENIDQDEIYFSSFNTVGYHRTTNELSKKKTLTETIIGSQIAYKKNRITMGVSAVQMQWNLPIQKNIKTYNQFEFNDNKNLNIGFNYNYIFKNFNFFGEAARSASGGTAFVNGSLITLDPKLTIAIVHRNYSRDYHVMHRLYYGNGIGSSTRTSNEKGLYIGLEARPIKSLTLNAYFDQYAYPWMTYSITAPSNGFQYLLQVTYKPNKIFESYLRFRQKNRATNGNTEIIDGQSDGSLVTYSSHITGIDPVVKSNINVARWHLSYKLNENITLRNRVEFSSYNEPYEITTRGFMMYQDILYRPIGKKYQIAARYTMFETDDYNTGIYVFENNVLYAYSLAKVYGRGSRAYVLVRIKASRNFDFWVRLAQTYYSDRNIIGSGLDEIEGRTKTDIHAQVRIKF